MRIVIEEFFGFYFFGSRFQIQLLQTTEYEKIPLIDRQHIGII